MMKKPSFFVVGAPKSGSTSMCNYLAQNSPVFFLRIKNPICASSSFFDTFVSLEPVSA